MNTYLVHPNDTQLKSMDLHLYDNEHNKLKIETRPTMTGNFLKNPVNL